MEKANTEVFVLVSFFDLTWGSVSSALSVHIYIHTCIHTCIRQESMHDSVLSCHKQLDKTFPGVGLKKKTSQELRMLSSVTLNCQVTKIIMNSGSQLSHL